MKPTLEQIFDFGTEKVDKEYIKVYRGKEREVLLPAKRYKLGIIYQVCTMYGYTIVSIANYLNISRRAVTRMMVYSKNNSFNFEEDVNELKNSLDYIYKYSIFAQKKDNLITVYKEEKSKLSFEDWLITRL